MASLISCDNKRCEKEVPQGAQYFTLVAEGELTLSDYPERQFCCLDCVAEYAADACGMVVNRA